MSAADAPAARPTGSGPGRLLVLVYGVLAVAATARSAVQIGRDLEAAPLAYTLSAVAGLVYLVATVALARGTGGWRRVAWAAVVFEAVGVVVVGLLSVLAPDLFPDDTVWSRFGAGYGFVPLVLPALGLAWLVRTRGSAAGPRR
ncbi:MULTISPECIES: hypothetical protein [unclassified Actinotalea]|uniref:hypothetical protein n=1 Tax=unclassified Actinotalea TaxID=2638618 RepID=UPI0015F683F3|nr:MULTISPECIES: hypothetical protein [unclassified Actinotalea]